MRSARPFSAGTSRAARRHSVVLLALALCLWLWAFAMHLHSPDEQSSTGMAHGCSYCLLLSATAASPPITPQLQQPLQIALAIVPESSTTLDGGHFPASYLSRAPPAR